MPLRRTTGKVTGKEWSEFDEFVWFLQQQILPRRARPQVVYLAPELCPDAPVGLMAGAERRAERRAQEERHLAAPGAGIRDYRVLRELRPVFQADIQLVEWQADGPVRLIDLWFVRPELLALPGAEEQLRRDVAQLKGRFGHRGCLGWWQTQAGPALAYQHHPGPTLADLLRWPVLGEMEQLQAEAVALVLSVAECIVVAYEQLPGEAAHGDLRPQWIGLVGDEDSPVSLGGWGFGRFLPVACPSGEWSVWGGRCYQAPERVWGEKPSVKNDIFALGAMLFELLSGWPPYGYTDSHRLLLHLTEGASALPRPWPQDLNVDRELADIVQKACSVNPADRYRSAQHFVDDLRFWAEAHGPLPSFAHVVRRRAGSRDAHWAGPDGRGRELSYSSPLKRGDTEQGLQVTQLVGRVAVRQWFHVRLRDVQRGQGAVLAMRARRGMGRSRLLDSLARGTKDVDGVTCLRLRSAPRERVVPMAAVLRCFASLAGAKADGALHEALAWEDIFAGLPLDAAALAVLQSLAGAGEAVDSARAIGLLTPALEGCLARRTEKGPVVVFWDDAHFVDELSRAVFNALWPVLRRQAVLVLLSEAGDGVFEGLPTTELSPLSLRESAALITARLPGVRGIEPSLLAAFVDQCAGSPLLLEVLTDLTVRSGVATVESGELVRRSSTAACDFSSVFGGLLARQAEEVRRVAYAAAAAGDEIHQPLLARVTALSPEVVASHLRLLTRWGLVEWDAAGVRFRHRRFRRVLLALVAPDVLLRLGRATSEVLRQSGWDHAEEAVGKAAEVMAHGGDFQGAAEFLIAVADRFRTVRDHGAAARWLAQGLAYGRRAGPRVLPLARELSLCRDLGDFGWLSFNVTIAEGALRQAFDIAQEIGDQDEAVAVRVALSRVLSLSDRPTEAIETAKEALAQARRGGRRGALIESLAVVGETYQHWGQFGSDLFAINTAYQLAQQSGDLWAQGRTMYLVALHAAAVGRNEYARKLLVQGRSIVDQLAHHDRVAWLSSQYYRVEGLFHIFRRDLVQGHRTCLVGLSLARDSGMVVQEMLFTHLVGYLYLELGQQDEAVYYLEESLRRARAAGYQQLVEPNEMFLGYIEATSSHSGRGLQRLEAAVDQARRQKRIWNLAQGYLLLGRVLHREGCQDYALRSLERALHLARVTQVRFFINVGEKWLHRARTRPLGRQVSAAGAGEVLGPVL
jgi:tetratricopeptide (TPR) repeat protein